MQHRTIRIKQTQHTALQSDVALVGAIHELPGFIPAFQADATQVRGAPGVTAFPHLLAHPKPILVTLLWLRKMPILFRVFRVFRGKNAHSLASPKIHLLSCGWLVPHGLADEAVACFVVKMPILGPRKTQSTSSLRTSVTLRGDTGYGLCGKNLFRSNHSAVGVGVATTHHSWANTSVSPLQLSPLFRPLKGFAKPECSSSSSAHLCGLCGKILFRSNHPAVGVGVATTHHSWADTLVPPPYALT